MAKIFQFPKLEIKDTKLSNFIRYEVTKKKGHKGAYNFEFN